MTTESSKTPVHPGTNRTPEVPLMDKDQKLLLRILSTQSDSGYDKESGVHRTLGMQLLIKKLARSYGARVKLDKENVYVTKGKAEVYPCYVAHTDTVHDLFPESMYAVYEDPDYFGAMFGYDQQADEYRGVGGDDKVGIFIALAMVRDLPAAKAVFFRDEEIGCIGAKEADMDFFADCAFAIECDRRGNADMIRSASGTELSSQEWIDAIQPAMTEYGYSVKLGSVTDVAALKQNGLGIVACNMSCGYYRPHTSGEYVIPGDVGRTLAYVRRITELTGDRQWLHKHKPFVYTPIPKVPAVRLGGEWSDDDWYGFGGSWYARSRKSYTKRWESKLGLECPDCEGNLGWSGWCQNCYRYWNDEEVDERERNRAILKYGTLDEYQGGDEFTDDAPPCTNCGMLNTVFDVTVGMSFCFDCGAYFDLSGGWYPVDWWDGREPKDEEGGVIDLSTYID